MRSPEYKKRQGGFALPGLRAARPSAAGEYKRRQGGSVLLAAVALLALANAAHPAPTTSPEGEPLLVILAPRAEIASLEVRLGDVARIAGKNAVYRELAASLSLGFAPVAGTQRAVSRPELEGRLVDAGLPASSFVLTGATTCLVQGVGTTLAQERFEETARTFVAERLRNAGRGERVCRVVGGARSAVIPGELPGLVFRAEFVGRPVVEGVARVLVRVEHEGLTLVRQVIDVEIGAAPAPPSERPAESHGNAGRSNGDGPHPPEDTVLVQRGDLVEVETVVGNVRVTTRGRARERAGLGEVIAIEIQDPQTGRRRSELAARVLGPGRVRVVDAGTGR